MIKGCESIKQSLNEILEAFEFAQKIHLMNLLRGQWPFLQLILDQEINRFLQIPLPKQLISFSVISVFCFISPSLEHILLQYPQFTMYDFHDSTDTLKF